LQAVARGGKTKTAEWAKIKLYPKAEAERLAGTAAQLSASASKEEVAKLLKDANELCRELSTRWLEITERVFTIQSRLQQQLAEAGGRLQAAK
jgi:hypothetical protein